MAYDFFANLAAAPNPNDGNFTLTFTNYMDDPFDDSYNIQERFAGGAWIQIGSTSSTSYQISGRAAGDYDYRIQWVDYNCFVNRQGEPICLGPQIKYSEEIAVTVQAAGGGDPGDPYTPPGPFVVPDDTDFPDAAIVNPSVPPGDVGLNSVGALQGSGGVSGGQASYSIPVVVPPGRKGMQPSVSLSYSSSAGNGIAGVGWGLNATSGISRCAATAAQDGFTSGVQYDAGRDRLCLDGQRLMVVSGTYGASGSEYRTELDTFARVKQFGAINGTSTYFTVEYKDGRKGTFGSTTATRHIASGRSETLRWALRDLRDFSGNTIVYDYISYGDGEYHVSAIHYTGYNGSTGDRHVRFEYEARPDVRTSYMAAGKTRNTQRLKKIKTEYLSTLVREYTLDYAAVSASTGRSLLRSVEECAYQSGIKHCLPATTLEWQEQATAFADREQLQFHNGSGWEVKLADKRWLHDVVPHGDINGDGVKDWPSWFTNAEGQIVTGSGNGLANCFAKSNSFTLTCLEVDFDADGITDSFRASAGNTLEVKRAAIGTWINTGIPWEDAYSIQAVADTPLGFADFNGDGWIDLAMRHDAKLYVYLHTQNVNAPYSTSAGDRVLVHSYTLSSGGLYYTQDFQLYGDMDGNGTADFISSNTDVLLPGLPKPSTIYLTQSNVGGGLTITQRSITIPGPGEATGVFSKFANAVFFHDLNGDGLTDMLRVDSRTEASAASGAVQYRLNNGTDFEPAWTDLGFTLPMRGPYVVITGGPEGEAHDYFMPIMSMVHHLDYDGDGRSGFLVAGSVVASVCAKYLEIVPPNSSAEVWACDNDLYGGYKPNSFQIVNSPINADLEDDSVRNFVAYEITESSGGVFGVTAPIATSIVASATQTAIIDATGDGLPDVVTALGCRQVDCFWNTDSGVDTYHTNPVEDPSLVEGAWINRNLGTAQDVPGNNVFEYGARDVLQAVQDGLGVRNEWEYRPLSSDAYNAGNSDFYDTIHSYQQNDYDYFHFASSMYVVAEHRASNGIGGLNSTQYRYRGAIYNNKGRGFQGFRAIEVEQDIYGDAHPLASTDKISRTEFHQKWPTSSIVETACAWLATDYIPVSNPECSDVEVSVKLLSKTTTDVIRNVATSGGARFVAPEDQTVISYDLATRQAMVTKTTDRTFDTAGNVISETQSHVDDWTSNSRVTARTIQLDWAGWWLNKVTSETITHNPVSSRHISSPPVDTITQDQTKTVTTSYDTYDLANRLPTSITISANDSALTQTVTSTYNTYGLPTNVTTIGTDVTGPRTVDTTYSSDGTMSAIDGYFPYTIENALGHVVTQNTDPATGLPTSQWDPNGLLSVTSYDAFGRVSHTQPAGQPTAYQRFFWCGGVVTCPTNAVYMVKAYAAGAPDIEAYFDKIGREIQSSTETFDGSGWVNTLKSYDERGNVTFESAPFDIGAGEPSTVGTRYLDYDALGRLTSKEVDQTDSQILLTTYEHAGLTTNINAGGILMSRTYNGLGQLVETADGEGGFTRYAYDGAGNPIVIVDPEMDDNLSIVGIKAAYNALGHKQWVEDPDWWDDSTIPGTWGRKTFEYSALGEVLRETDPNGNDIEMLYDELGRLIQRKVNGELNGKWYFDDPGTYGGLGLLWLEDSQFRPDGSRLQKFYYYSDAATGRKDLLQVTHRFYENDDPNDFTDYATAYFTDGFYGRPKGLRYPGGTSLAYTYNDHGYVTQERDPVSGTVHREVTNRDSRSAVTAASIAQNGGAFTYQYAAGYHSETGQADYIDITYGGVSQQRLEYGHDVFGNLDFRSTNVGGGATETLLYDDLQRLITSTRSYSGGDMDVVNYTFDKSGSFTSKSDYASSYGYHPDRPHVISQVTLAGGGTVVFSHDNNGNITHGDAETIDYNAFNKPTLIAAISGPTEMRFEYGADLMRYKQITPSGGTIYYLDKLMEIEQLGSAIDYRHYLGDIAVLTKTGDLNDPTPSVDYLIRDRLGSVVVIGDNTGFLAETRAYDAYGRPRNGNWTDKSLATLNSGITDRGFTDHEHLDTWQLIHMNGRGFDYNLGRFLSIDPVIQAPGNSQSINPYSYIINNPLSGTDPSGYESRSRFAGRFGHFGLYGADGDFDDDRYGGLLGEPGALSFGGLSGAPGFNGLSTMDRQSARYRFGVVTVGDIPDEISPEQVVKDLERQKERFFDDARNKLAGYSQSDAPPPVVTRILKDIDDLIAPIRGVVAGRGPYGSQLSNTQIRELVSAGLNRIEMVRRVERPGLYGVAVGYENDRIVLSNPSADTAHGEVSLLGHQLGGSTSAAEAGFTAVVTVLQTGDNSISSRGAHSNISRAIWASQLNKGMPIFLLVPRHHKGKALMIEYVFRPGQDTVAVVDEVRFR